MNIIEFALVLPYIAATICLVSSCFFWIRQGHVIVPLSSIWWPLRLGYGVALIDKDILTPEGLELHKNVIRRVWWSVRFAVCGLVLGVAYAVVSGL